MTRMTRRERDTIVRAAANAAAAERGRPQPNRRAIRKEGDPPPDLYAEDRARGAASPYNLAAGRSDAEGPAGGERLMLRRAGDETIDFSDAREAIEAVLAKFGDLDGVSDVNISGGEASVRRRGFCTPVDVQVDGDELHEIANLIAAACNTEVNRKVPIVEQRIPPGYRVSFTHPTKVQGGSWNCSIRLLPTEVIPLGQYVEDGYLDHRDRAPTRGARRQAKHDRDRREYRRRQDDVAAGPHPRSPGQPTAS